MGLGTAAIEAGRAYVRLYTDSSEYVKGLRAAESKLNAFGNRIGNIGARLTGFATAAAIPIAISTKTFAEFQDQMLSVQAISKATRAEFARLYDQAKQLGASTSFSAVEVAGGQVELARAGFSPDEIEAAIPSVLALARATGTDLAFAAETAGGTLRAFNLDAKEMPRVADVMVATANNSSQSLQELSESMAYAAPIAAEYGLSIEQTAKALGVMANMQIKGSQAGTSLRQIMLRLADTGVQEKLHEIGVEALDSAGNLRPLGDVMVDIGKKMAGMSNGQRISLGKDLFDQRAVGGALKLVSSDFEGLDQAIANASGTAQRTADVMDSGLGGSFRRLMSAVEGVKIAIGEALVEELTAGAQTIQQYVAATGVWIQSHQGVIETAVKLLAVVGAIGVPLLAIAAGAKTAAFVIGGLTMAMNGLTAAMTLVAAHPAIAAIAVLAAGVAALSYALDSAQTGFLRTASFQQELVDKSDKLRAVDVQLMNELQQLAATQKLTSDEMDRAGEIISQLEGRYGDLGITLDKTTGKIAGVTDGFAKMRSAMQENLASELKAAMLEMTNNIMDLNKERERIQGVWFMSNGGRENAIRDIDLRQLEQLNKLKALGSRYEALKSGDTESLYQNEPSTPSGSRRDAQFPVPDRTPEEASQFNQRMMDEIANQRIQGIEDEQERAIAAINKRYDAEREKARELGADLAIVEKARKAALETANAQSQRRKDEVKERTEKAKAAANQRLQDEITALKIDTSTPDGIERRKKQLELEREQALRDAEKQGLDPKAVKEKFDLEAKKLDIEARAAAFSKMDATRSTTSAEAAFRMGQGRKRDTAADKTAAATASTAKQMETLVTETKQLRQVVQNGGMMGK